MSSSNTSYRMIAVACWCALVVPCSAWAQAMPADVANAIDIPSPDIHNASFTNSSVEFSSLANRRVAASWGANLFPRAGQTFGVLSTGKALVPSDVGFVRPAPGTNSNLSPPDALRAFPFQFLGVLPTCRTPPYDVVALRIELRVPIGATGLRSITIS